MGIGIKGPGAWCTVALLYAVSLAAASDLRLVEATERGDTQAVRSLLKQHADVNTPQADGATALAWAAYRDDLETAGLLIQAGANANAANDYGATPLLLACINGSAPMVDKLLRSGADSNSSVWTGETALMRCARTGNLAAVKSLLAHGADVKASETRQGHTALMRAVAAKHTDVAQTLIEHGADVNARSKTGFTPLMFAAQQDDINSARILLAAGANVNAATEDRDTALLVASNSGHEALAIFLLDKGADPNAAERNGITALHYALLKGLVGLIDISTTGDFAPFVHRPNMVELVKALLSHGANPNARLVAPMAFNESGPGYGKILRVEFSKQGRVSPVGATPFVMAALTHDARVMRILAENGADPLLATEENVTPLMVAAGLVGKRNLPALTEEEETRALEAVKVSLELGGDVNAVNNLGLTALHGATLCGSDRIVQLLAESGADLDVKDKVGQTPLDKALNIQPAGKVARNLRPAVVRKSTADLLLKLGATPVNTSAVQRPDLAAASQ